MTGPRQIAITLRPELLDRLAGLVRTDDLNATCPIATTIRETVPGIGRVHISQFLIFFDAADGWTFTDATGLRIRTIGCNTPARLAEYITTWDSAPPEVRRRLLSDAPFTIRFPGSFRLVQS